MSSVESEYIAFPTRCIIHEERIAQMQADIAEIKEDQKLILSGMAKVNIMWKTSGIMLAAISGALITIGMKVFL